MTGYITYSKPNDKKLMKLFIDCPDYVRRIVISDTQAAIVKMMRESGEESITARMLADWRGISIQSASTQLTKLWHTGYVIRKSVVDPTGGIIYRYRSAI